MASSPEQKSDVNVDDTDVSQQLDDSNVVDEKKGTPLDRMDMFRMGKVQELRRNFRFISIFGFSMILMSSWEAVLGVAQFGLVNGGTAGLIWIFLICWIAFLFINTSMAEMGSMAPTTGGQYHWVSEFAPRENQKFISYLMGWLCVLGWQALCASTAFATGTQIQGLVVLNYPDYNSQNWHGTLITIAAAGFSVFFNIFLARKLPLIEGMLLVIHIFAFFGILVSMWVLAPTADAHTVFTQFSDGGGWSSLGGSALVGITSGIIPLLGADAAVHMSEELRDAGKTLPRSMIWSTFFNGALGWVMVITISFCLGDLETVLSTPTGYPYIQIFLTSVQSTSGATAMASFVVAMNLFCNLTMVATASRQLFAFARDKAVPFSPFLSKVSPNWDLPINSICVTFVTSSLLSLINIGSSIALNSITSLATNALLSSYICSIGCVTWRRWTNGYLPPAKFKLGKWSLLINCVSEIFLVIFFILAFFPMTTNPDAAGMNWNILIYGVVVIFSLTYYYFKGRYQYVGPVAYVRKLD